MLSNFSSPWSGLQNGQSGGITNIKTPITSNSIFDPNSQQLFRNQARAQGATMLGSGMRNMPGGVSSTYSDDMGQLQQLWGNRVAGEGAAQQGDLQARLANAQQRLAAQSAASQSANALAGGVLDRQGIDQRLQYGLANQDLTRSSMGTNALMNLLGQLL